MRCDYRAPLTNERQSSLLNVGDYFTERGISHAAPCTRVCDLPMNTALTLNASAPFLSVCAVVPAHHAHSKLPSLPSSLRISRTASSMSGPASSSASRSNVTVLLQ